MDTFITLVDGDGIMDVYVYMPRLIKIYTLGMYIF